MRIRGVLWDADGVLQQGPVAKDPFFEILGEHAEEFGARVWGRLDDLLAGRLRMVEHVDGVLRDLGLQGRRDDVLALWERIEPLAESRSLVTAVRSAGFPSYLATNQDDLRAETMRRLLGYDELLDGCYYSCNLRVAKPAPAYFLAIADDLGMLPEDLLFVDDSLDNIDGARETGLWTIHWHHDHGIDALVRRLGVHGVRPA